MNTLVFDEKHQLNKQLVAIRINYKWGLINEYNDILMRVVYDYIYFNDGQLWAIYKGYKFRVPMRLLPMKYDCIYEFKNYIPEKKLACVVLDSKYGIADENLNSIIKCEYDSFKDFNGAFWFGIHRIDSTIYSVYSYNGSLISSGYECVPNPFSKIVKKKDENSTVFGIIDNHSCEIIPCNNTSIHLLSENHIFPFNKEIQKPTIYDIESKSHYHFIFSSSKGLIDVGYNKIEQKKLNYFNKRKLIFAYRNVSYPRYSDEIIISYKTTSSIIDIYDEDNLILTYNENEYNPISHIINNLFICESLNNKKLAIISNTFFITPFIYDAITYYDNVHIITAVRESEYSYNNKYKPVRINGIIDIYDDSGKLLLNDVKYKDFDKTKCGYNEGYIFLDIGKLLYVFHNNKLIASSHMYDSIDSFFLNFGKNYGNLGPYADLGYAIVKIEDKCGVINSNGEMLIQAIYEKIEGICEIIVENKKAQSTSTKPLILQASNHDSIHFFMADINLRRLNIKYICQERINNFFIYSNNTIPLTCKNLDDLQEFIMQSIITKQDIKFGVIDSQGNIVIPPSESLDCVLEFIKPKDVPYKELWDSKCSECTIVKDIKTNKVGLLNYRHERLCDFEYDSISEFNEEGMAITNISDIRYGIINKFGEIILPCNYKVYADYSRCEISYKSQRYGFRFCEGYVVISDGNRFGLINKKGKIVIPCQYPKFVEFIFSYQLQLLRKGYIVVQENKKIGLVKISNPNVYLLKTRYDFIDIYDYDKYIPIFYLHESVKEKFIIAGNGQEALIINIESGKILFSITDVNFCGFFLINDKFVATRLEDQGQTFIRFFRLDNPEYHKDYSDISYWNEHYAQVCHDNMWGIFDLNSGEEVIPCIYEDAIINPYDKIFTIKLNGKYGFYNLSNKKIIPCSYEKVHNFRNGFAAIYSNHYWHFINELGDVVAGRFEDVLDYSENYAAAKKDGKWGFINSEGHVEIPFRFTNANSFSEGLAAVAFKVKFGYIDKYNNTIIPFLYDSAFPFTKGSAYVYKKYEGSGHITKDGIIIDWDYPEVESNYDDNYNSHEENWYAMTDGQYGDIPEGFDGDFDFMGQ